MSDFRDLLQATLSPSVEVPHDKLAQLERHYSLLVHWNKIMNVTAIRSLDEAVVRHYAESVLFAEELRVAAGSRVVDVGSGGGFPGIPMAIWYPEAEITLVESHARKSVFLSEAARNLGLSNVVVRNARIEAVQEEFDWLVSRAVAWGDFKKVAVKLASRVGLLAGAADGEEIMRDGRFSWQQPVALPWGDRRVMVVGQRR